MNELGEQLVELWGGYMEHIENKDIQSRSVATMIQEKRPATFEGMMTWLIERARHEADNSADNVQQA